MKDIYKNTIQMIKRLKEVPSQSEWNEIAKTNGLLSYASIQYLENMRFKDVFYKLKGIK